jgi:hypothetical protein
MNAENPQKTSLKQRASRERTDIFAMHEPLDHFFKNMKGEDQPAK